MKTNYINQAAELEGAYLAKGESARGLLCPVCKGGTNEERTFTVSRVDDGLVYNCYRATCGTRGFIPTSGRLVQPSQKHDPRESLRPYYGEYNPLSDKDFAYFKERFDLSRIPEFAIGVTERQEYVFAVRGPDGQRIRGYLIRAIPWGGSPQAPRQPTTVAGKSKSFLLMHALGATQSWFVGEMGLDTVVLVEDHISAMKVAQQGVTAVAIIGTNIDEVKVREIALTRPKQVIIALDQDATATAFKHARRWGLAFDSIRVAMLESDIKDTDNDKILGVLGL